MEDSTFSRRSLSIALGLSLLIVLFIFVKHTSYNKTRIVFCDVGQGDAAYIRTSGNIDILIDAGPSGAVITCLGKYMPFYDRKIELAFMTHPQKDHYGGYLSILDRYTVDTFIAPPVDNDNQSFNQLKNKIRQKKISVRNMYTGQDIFIGNKSKISFIWPSKELMRRENGNASKNVLGEFTSTTDLNEYSEVFTFSEGNFEVLFTGDISAGILDSFVAQGITNSFKNLEILKVPHHGSKNGLTLLFLKAIDPDQSIISVAKKNRYGHPSREITNMFQALHKKYLTTAEHGDVVVEVDRSGWKVIN